MRYVLYFCLELYANSVALLRTGARYAAHSELSAYAMNVLLPFLRFHRPFPLPFAVAGVVGVPCLRKRIRVVFISTANRDGWK